jgi:hypothetical protein
MINMHLSGILDVLEEDNFNISIRKDIAQILAVIVGHI